jgi:hypothetical protein
MKKIGQLMQEIGFKKDAPDSVKEAFIKHLIKASTGASVFTPSEKKEVELNPETVIQLKAPQQLSFDFIDTEPKSNPQKKAVS